jgi:molybdate transport system ATP-binding protein
VNSFHLSARYAGFELDAEAAWDVPCAALFGASGSGKTTILEAMAGLRPEVRGRVVLRDRALDALSSAARRIGWVPQDASLFPHLTVRGNLAFAARARGVAAASEKAIAALEIGALLERRTGDLSGGERQRVAIARALASAPDFLLLDEPLASIDRPLRARILPFLQRLPGQTGVPILIVTHDPHEVVALASYVIVLQRGKVVAQGDPRDILASPATLGVLDALGAENAFTTRVIASGRGMLSLETAGGCRLEMAVVNGFPEPAAIAVRSEDVTLSVHRPELVSAQNVLEGRIESLEALGDHVYVRIASGGERWTAKVTSRAVERLALAPRQRIYMLIKAHAIHPYG